MGSAYVIFAHHSAWPVAKVVGGDCQIVPVEQDGEAMDPRAAAAAAAKALRGLGYKGEGTLLALPSSLCLCAVVDEKGVRHRSRETGLRFRLEEQLPLALEEMVADFIPGHGQALGIATSVASVEPLIESLEAQGIAIASICPAALLVADQAMKQQPADLVLCAMDDNVDCMEIGDSRVKAWSMLPPSAAALDLHLRLACKNHAESLKVLCVGMDPSLLSEINIPGVELIVHPTPAAELSATAAQRCLSDSSPPVQLRRGKLAVRDPLRQVRAPLRAAVASALILAVCLAVSMLISTRKYNRLALESRIRQEQAFHQALPHQTPPPSVASRLISEEKRLRGLSGTGSSLPPPMSVLPLLHDTLAGLPANMRFRLVELRFEPQRLYLEGQTLDHSDADQIAAALRRSTGLQVDPPHTEQPAGEDVTFTISGSAPATAAVASSKMVNP